MSFATFSGPVRIGTVKDNTPGRNTGLVELVQTATIPAAAITTAPTAQQLFTLPAGSKIIDFGIDVTTAVTGASAVGVSFGRVGGTATQYATSISTGTAAGRVAKATVDTALQVAAIDNVGTSDVAVTATATATTANATAGVLTVFVRYLQRLDDGTANPITA